MSPVLEVKNLSIEIPVGRAALRPVRDVSFRVNRGELLCIVGESGCGKSLTSLAVMGLLPPAARIAGGSIALNGATLPGADERKWSTIRGARISMIFQEPMSSLNPVLTIGEQLTEGFLRHGRGNASQATARALELLDKVRVGNPETRLRQYPHQLSGGLRQRVMIAMALMCEPDLLIADEPTTALDVTVQVQVLKLLKSLQLELGISIVFVTHDLGVVAHIADTVIVMYGGEVVEAASAQQIFGRPAHPYTRGLLQCLPKGGHEAPPLGTIPGSVPQIWDEAPYCVFANRCADAVADCTKGRIDLRDTGSGHKCRCIFPAAPVSWQAVGK